MNNNSINIINSIFVKNIFEKYLNKLYIDNSLNQYTSIDSDFVPTFDMDGNQTKVKTSTGIWEVTYNAENRPVKFRNDNFFIVMNYDYQGRRIQKTVYENDVITADEKFMYNGYRLIQRIKNEHVVQSYAWDLNDNLRFVVNDSHIYSVLHDANRSVTQLMADSVMMMANYEYSPFGAVTVSSGPLASMNPFRFSSEYHDDELGLVYYNYRHYNALDGRWINRDPIEEDGGWNLYGMVGNNCINRIDYNGLFVCPEKITLILYTRKKTPEGVKIGAVRNLTNSCSAYAESTIYLLCIKIVTYACEYRWMTNQGRILVDEADGELWDASGNYYDRVNPYIERHTVIEPHCPFLN